MNGHGLSIQDEFERAQQYGHVGSSSAVSTSSSGGSSATDSGVATPQLSTRSQSQPQAIPISLSAGVSASLAQQGYFSQRHPAAASTSTSTSISSGSSISRSNTALQLSPGPFNVNYNSSSAYELGSSFKDASPGGFMTGNEYSEVLGRESSQAF